MLAKASGLRERTGAVSEDYIRNGARIECDDCNDDNDDDDNEYISLDVIFCPV